MASPASVACPAQSCMTAPATTTAPPRTSRSGSPVDGTNYSETDAIGRIANTADVTIGAKPTNEDFFDGLIDDAQITVA